MKHSTQRPTVTVRGIHLVPGRDGEENIGAANVALTGDDLRAIDRAASAIRIQGARYPDALERRTGL